jgi:glycosyltransferase involved in cell wall biosynthesis
MARLIILTPAELTRDPRARRAAATAIEWGWDVVGLCPATGGTQVEFPGVQMVRVRGERVATKLRSAGLGGGRPSRPLLRELRGLYRIGRLTRLTVALWLAGRRVGRADVVHANDFDTLPAGCLLASTLSARLVYDVHELYTLQEADAPRLHLRLVRRLEGLLARRASAVVTVSEPIAGELKRLLGLGRTPLVVLNCPPTTSCAAVTSAAQPLRAVYQGAVGHGRSLEDLLVAAADTVNVTFALRVIGVDSAILRLEVERRGLTDRMTVLEPVDPGALVEALAEFDVGIVITRPLTRNDELAAPNKLFEYLMAGLAVAVPRLPGVAAIVEAEQVGIMFEPGSPRALAAALSELARRPDEVSRCKQRAREVAVTRFNAESQRPALAAAWGA